jgi:nucleoid-associated protein YgaU
MGNCGWIIATRVARWTGVKPFAELADLAKAAGLNSIKATGGVLSVDELAQPLENLKVSTKIVKGVGSMKDLATVVAENPNGTVMFGVRWINPNTGKGAGHVLYAVRNLFGGITIVDRTGEFATTLADLEEVVPKTAGNSYLAGIGKGTVDATAIVAKNSPLITSLGTVPTVANIISAAAAAGGENGASNQASGSTGSRAASAAAGSGGATKAAGSAVTPGTLTVTASTICIQPNSDMPVSCNPSVSKTYKVGRGEGLSMIAQRVYGDSSKWQMIAAANGIKPPKYMIYPGQVLIIP